MVVSHRQEQGEWIREETPLPALLSGIGGRGRGCEVKDLAADYVADCRSVAAGHCVIAVDSARHEIWVRATGQAEWRQLPLPAGQQLVSFGATKDEIILEMEGVGTYGQEYILDFDRLALKARKPTYPPVALPGFRDSMIWLKMRDGASVPCQLRWRTNHREQLKGTVLKVYAAYGNPYLAGHRAEDIALMNLGYAVGYVHARGGGARGPAWYDAGREKQKLRACQDYLEVVRYFNEQEVYGPIIGYAQSAGGPVLGFAVNEAPQLFRAAIFDHAFLDVAGIMARPELPLTKYEYPEWGNPKTKSIAAVQAQYSPYQNLRAQAYPALLFLAGRYDQSTPYWQVAKQVATLRELNQGKAPILLHTSLWGSHPGTPFGPRFDRLLEQLVFVVANSSDKLN